MHQGIATGSPNGSSLEKFAEFKGYTFLPFPSDVGGRFSVLSAVGLLPIAAGGISLDDLLAGAMDTMRPVQRWEQAMKRKDGEVLHARQSTIPKTI